MRTTWRLSLAVGGLLHDDRKGLAALSAILLVVRPVLLLAGSAAVSSLLQDEDRRVKTGEPSVSASRMLVECLKRLFVNAFAVTSSDTEQKQNLVNDDW